MNITKRKPVSVGEMMTEEFLVPMALTQGVNGGQGDEGAENGAIRKGMDDATIDHRAGSGVPAGHRPVSGQAHGDEKRPSEWPPL